MLVIVASFPVARGVPFRQNDIKFILFKELNHFISSNLQDQDSLPPSALSTFPPSSGDFPPFFHLKHFFSLFLLQSTQSDGLCPICGSLQHAAIQLYQLEN
jgi:hypothetical protein